MTATGQLPIVRLGRAEVNAGPGSGPSCICRLHIISSAARKDAGQDRLLKLFFPDLIKFLRIVFKKKRAQVQIMSRFWKISEAALGLLFNTWDEIISQTLLLSSKNARIDVIREPVGIGALFQICCDDQSLNLPTSKECLWRISFVPEESTAFHAGLQSNDIILQVKPADRYLKTFD